MFVSLFYEKLPYDVIKHVLTFIGDEYLHKQIKSFNIITLNKKDTIKMSLMKLSQIRVPILDSVSSKHFNYVTKNRIFKFETPLINFLMNKLNIQSDKVFHLKIGINKLNNDS